MTTNDKAVISAIDDEHETRWYVVNLSLIHISLGMMEIVMKRRPVIRTVR